MTHDDSEPLDPLLRAVAKSPLVASPLVVGVTPGGGLTLKPAGLLHVGEVVGERFEVERLAGSGGMGTVYRALDRVTGAPVALKLVTSGGKDDERFVQEARVLAELSHPTIVRYVSHGATPSGRRFLAMEWLDGADLGETLDRAGLGVAESVTVARRVAEALAVAHARGVIHRDVKPSNVFLVGGDAARTKLLDFGIVRLPISGLAGPRALTRTGVALGTVGYMSPEQATADPGLDVRTDVFALGCVLFECLTGEPAFSGDQVVAVLAKVLREEPPRIRELRPELPAKLDDLVGSMLAKDRSKRPADARAVLLALEDLGALTGGAPAGGVRISDGLSVGEKRIVCVILAIVPDDPSGRGERLGPGGRHDEGGWIRLANGAWLMSLRGSATADEQVRAAAARALALRRASPAARIGLATGRAQSTGGAPPGPVIDQAADLLTHSAAEGVWIDELTAGILGQRFDVTQDERGRRLVGLRREDEPPRTLLGRLTPYVGRDREIGILDGTLRECIDDAVARSVLVTGPPGQGKSRLRHEFIARVRDSGNVRVLSARADPIGAGSAFMLARQLVRAAVGLGEGEGDADQDRRLRAYTTAIAPDGDPRRLADFLGELLGGAPVQAPSPQLRAARNDPQLMGEWLRRSFGEWIAAESAAGPLLVVLDDLHWGDVPTVAYLGEALRALADRPLMMLALARPEATATFASMWPAREALHVSLTSLSPRAAGRLVRAALGPTLAADVVTRLVERASGNPFYLEELIRRESEGGSGPLPETVLALVESRLQYLEPDARRVARAASVFGETFSDHGLAAVLGQAPVAADLDAWLKILSAREVFTASSAGRSPGTRQYRFHHGLLREAAYAMLTDADRVVGHRLAGEWLEGAGETDALTIAEHFERSEPARAAPWLLRAEELACDGGHLEAVFTLASRGLACEPSDSERGTMLGLQGVALAISGQWLESLPFFREALALSPEASPVWYRHAMGLVSAGMYLGDPELCASALRRLLSVKAQPDPSGPYGMAIAFGCGSLGSTGQFGFGLSLLESGEDLALSTPDPDPVFLLGLRLARAHIELLRDEPGRALAALSAARTLADVAPAAAARAYLAMLTAHAFALTGRCDGAEEALRECESVGLNAYSEIAKCYVALAQLQVGRPLEAAASVRALLDTAASVESAGAQPHGSDPLTAAFPRGILALSLASAGDLDAAEREARIVLDRASMFSAVWACGPAALSVVAFARGRAAEALEHADRAIEGLARQASEAFQVESLRTQALLALGRMDAARASVARARDGILRVASTIEDPEARASYLTKVNINSAILALADALLVSEPASSG
jgi:eukaryotic-like serine/threonine-protein kinase